MAYTAPSSMTQTLTTAAATGAAMVLKYQDSSVFTAFAKGTFGSGTLTLEISPTTDSTTDWQAVPSISWTADGVKTISGYYAKRARGVLAGSTAATVVLTLVGVSSGVTVS